MQAGKCFPAFMLGSGGDVLKNKYNCLGCIHYFPRFVSLPSPSVKFQRLYCFESSGTPLEFLSTYFFTLNILRMKKFDTFFRNENVVAALVIVAVFGVVALISLWAYSQS